MGEPEDGKARRLPAPSVSAGRTKDHFGISYPLTRNNLSTILTSSSYHRLTLIMQTDVGSLDDSSFFHRQHVLLAILAFQNCHPVVCEVAMLTCVLRELRSRLQVG